MALSSLFTRRSAMPDPATWTPEGTTVVQRYRNVLGAPDGAVVLVYTHDNDRNTAYYAAACLGCTFRVARNRHGSVRLSENDAADLANTHAASCRAMNRGVPAAPDNYLAAKMVRDRLRSMREYGTTSPRHVSLSDLHADRVDLQRSDDFIKQMMLHLVSSEPDFLTTEPHARGTGTYFLLQPHPARS
ncbi:hypothetical protein [Streptomyces sp. NPDC050121]|uniref:hypothetical protein n=1 Tax=Streptomyces sp. NPDC050121 TaxID=3365601 RepID=UPI00378AE527